MALLEKTLVLNGKEMRFVELDQKPMDPMVSREWLRNQLGLDRAAKIVNVKGYASGLQNTNWHEEALEKLTNFQVLVFDGDWQKQDSFTSLVGPFLAADSTRWAVAFRKNNGQPISDLTEAGTDYVKKQYLDSWASMDQLPQLLTVLVPPTYIEKSNDELRKLLCIKFTEQAISQTHLGWTTLRFSGASLVLAVGGGPTTVNEATACLAWRYLVMSFVVPDHQNITLPDWDVLFVGRTTKSGGETPDEMMKIRRWLGPDPPSESYRSQIYCPPDSGELIEHPLFRANCHPAAEIAECSNLKSPYANGSSRGFSAATVVPTPIDVAPSIVRKVEARRRRERVSALGRLVRR